MKAIFNASFELFCVCMIDLRMKSGTPTKDDGRRLAEGLGRGAELRKVAKRSLLVLNL